MTGSVVLVGYRSPDEVEVSPEDRKRRVTHTVSRADKVRVTVTRDGERRYESC